MQDEQTKSRNDADTIALLLGLLFVAFVLLSGFFTVNLIMILLLSAILSFVVGQVGKDRRIGFAAAFLVSLFLSPLVGAVVAFNSPRIEDESYRERMMDIVSENTSSSSVADELQKLNELRKAGVLTDDEFATQKARLLGV